MPDTSNEPAPVGNPIASPCKPIPKYRRGEGVALDERTGQATQIEAQLYHNSTGQRPQSRGEQAGNDTGGKREQERTNEQDPQPKPKPNPTTAAQAKDPKAAASKRETSQEASTNKNEQERTRTNKGTGEPRPKKEKSAKGAEALPSPSDRRSQGTRQRTQQPGSRHEG